MSLKAIFPFLLFVFISFIGRSQFTEKQVSNFELSNIFMVNTAVGFAGGTDGIFKTSNGGQNWTLLPYFVSTYQSIDSIFFVTMGDHHILFLDENVGYSVGWGALGNYEQIIKTTDGGVTWQLQHMVNPDETPFQSPELRLQDIHAINENILITVGYRGRILKTADGGSNWVVKVSNVSNNLNTIEFVDSSNGIIGGEGIVLITNDGGEIWNTVSTGLNILDINYLSNQELIGVTNTNIVKSFDGGQTWSPVHIPNTSGFSELSFIDQLNGFVINDASLLKTTDGGSTFEQFSFADAMLKSVFAISTSEIYLSTKKGKVIYADGSLVSFSPLSFFQLTTETPCINQPFLVENKSYPGNSYTWYVDNVLVNTSYNLSYLFTSSGFHSITLIVDNGLNSTTYSQGISVRDFPALPNYKLKATNTSVCEGDALYLSVENLESSNSLQLFNENNEVIDTLTNGWKEVYFSSTTTVHINLQSTNECGTNIGTDTLTISVVPKPSETMQIRADKVSVCYGDSTFIEILNSEIGITYTLTESHHAFEPYYEVSLPGNGGTLKLPVPSIKKAGKFDLVGANSLECLTYYGEFNFTVRSFTVDFKLHSLFEFQNSDISLVNKSSADSYNWEFSDGSTPITTTELNPTVNYSSSGEKTIKLTGLVQEGCSKSVEKKFTVVGIAENRPLVPYSEATLTALDSTYIITDLKKIGNSIYVMGYLRGIGNQILYGDEENTLFVAKYAMDGSQLWMRKQLETNSLTNNSTGSNFAIDENENLYVTGYFMGGTFSFGDEVFESERLNHANERRSILMKIDADGKVIWGNVFELTKEVPTPFYSRIYLTDVLVSNDKLYLYLDRYAADDLVMLSPDSLYSLNSNEYLGGLCFMMDTTGHFLRIISSNLNSSIGNSRFIRTPDTSIDYVDKQHTPSLSINGDTLGVFISTSNVAAGGGYDYLSYAQKLQYSISNPSLGNVVGAINYPYLHRMHLYNYRSTSLDPMTNSYFETLSFKDIVKHQPGLMTIEGDSINVAEGGALMYRDKNSKLQWYKYFPYADIINVKAINSDVYVFGNFEDWMGVDFGSRNYKGIKGSSNGAFMAKLNSFGEVEYLTDFELPDFGKNVLYAMDANDCTNDFTLLGVGLNGYYVKTYSLDADISEQCLEVLFSASTREIQVGEAINFVDKSIGNPDQWEWNFEGASNPLSIVASPQGIVYNTPGNYTVSLTVYSGSRKEARTIRDYITVLAPLQAGFTADTTKVMMGSTINFKDQSEGSPTQWAWLFAGATPQSSTLKNPIVTFNNPGKYSIELTVMREGKSDTKVITDFINVYEPLQPNFYSSKQIIGVGEAVNFTNISLGYPTSFEWIFEGGQPSSSTDQNPTGIVYKNPGTYKVTFITRGNIQTKEKTVEGYITVQELISDFNASKNEAVVNELVTFTDLTTGFPQNWNWNFDGAIPANSTNKNVSISYASAGTYSVSLTANRDMYSNTVTKENFIRVFELLTPDFLADQVDIRAGEAINFQNLSGGEIATYTWSFPGGTPTTSVSQSPQGIVYNEAGEYDVVLTVSGNIQTVTNSKRKLIKVNLITAIEEEETGTIVLYPNPSSGTIFIKSSQKILYVELYNNLGIKVEDMNNIIDSEIKINSKPGLYFVKIQTTEGTVHLQKMVIK